ncbi:hypothetical protein CO709_23685 [Burkholderia thailandensis]|nr:hypothetical protein CO709_23685 [Burkholderia thailandensis]
MLHRSRCVVLENGDTTRRGGGARHPSGAQAARGPPPRPSSSYFARYHRQIPEPIAGRACGLYRCGDMPPCTVV